ncbi:hypothetical protein AN958_03187, partial [Leucoagaricus sp. SymC.cos]
DFRRVKAYGQEDDLRLVLDMVINRITWLSSLLSKAYKTQVDLEVQLNVAKSNLTLVIANNEILEDAFKRDNSTSSHDVPPQAALQVVPPPIPPHITKELEGLNADLQKARVVWKTARQEKTNLEAELEALSQALFEESNQMVTMERIKLAIAKEVLKNALQLIEGENHYLRTLRAASEIAVSSPALFE